MKLSISLKNIIKQFADIAPLRRFFGKPLILAFGWIYDKSPDFVRRTPLFIKEYRERFSSPYVAAEMGFVDEIIQPHETRPKLICALESLKNKNVVNEKQKHGNIPL